ncbi:hypothetical protein MRX96_016785 [Rhipicephalus microplus]
MILNACLLTISTGVAPPLYPGIRVPLRWHVELAHLLRRCVHTRFPSACVYLEKTSVYLANYPAPSSSERFPGIPRSPLAATTTTAVRAARGGGSGIGEKCDRNRERVLARRPARALVI